MSNIYETDRPPPEVVDWEKKHDQADHGAPGHIGFRCGQCAQDSTDHSVAITDHHIDYWQTKQIDWQEACDVVMRAFDQAVEDHFPEHQPQGCQTCPVMGDLPEKPSPPYERALGQIDTG